MNTLTDTSTFGGAALLYGALAFAVITLTVCQTLARFHRRGVARLRRLQWLDEARCRRNHPTLRAQRQASELTRRRLQGTR